MQYTMDERTRERYITVARSLFENFRSVPGINVDAMTDRFVRDLDRAPEPLDPEIWLAHGFTRDNP